MRIDILSVVPELLDSPLNQSILKRAQAKGVVEIHVHNIRDWSKDKFRKTDDYPFGGEAGMVMMVQPIFDCINELCSQRKYDEIIYTAPDAPQFLLLDEPLANLDAATAEKIEDLLLSIKNKTLLVVSHQFTAEKLSAFDSVINFNMANS